MLFYISCFIVFFLEQQTSSLSIGNYNVTEFIEEINTIQSDWVAEENQFSYMDTFELHKLMGLKKKPFHERIYKHFNYDIEVPDNIPESFDSRDQWPQCESIGSIKDQSNCGSCWAVSSASALSDRLCIASNFNIRVNLSAEALMTCCKECTGGDPGCDGGYIEDVGTYWINNGLVTGGDYHSYEGCQPYGIKPCATCTKEAHTPPCSESTCTNRKYQKPYADDLHKGKKYYAIPQKVDLIQADILKNGPLITGFVVFQDFMNYKKGVYRHVAGDELGNHAVRILGWGVDGEQKTPYWLVANSWNRSWGDNGLFKILRGTDECAFEENVYAGIPQ